MFRFALTLLRRVCASPPAAPAPLPRPLPPAPAARPRPRRTGARRIWRPTASEVLDTLTLQPLPAGGVVTRCLDCGAAYGPDSLAALLRANEGRCLACGTRRVTAQVRRAGGAPR